MRPSEIEAQLKQRPFIPLRMYLSDGSSYDVRHPEMAIVTRTIVMLAIYDGARGSMPERGVFCDPMHVTRLEPIDGQGPQS